MTDPYMEEKIHKCLSEHAPLTKSLVKEFPMGCFLEPDGLPRLFVLGYSKDGEELVVSLTDPREDAVKSLTGCSTARAQPIRDLVASGRCRVVKREMEFVGLGSLMMKSAK